MLFAFNNTNFLNEILRFFEEHSVSGMLAIWPQAKYLLIILAIIDLCTTWTLYDGNAAISEIIKRIIKVGFLVFLLSYFDQLVSAMLETFQYAGLTAAGLPISGEMLTPSALVNTGYKICRHLIRSMNFISFFLLGGFAKFAIYILCIVFTLIAFYLMAFQVLLTKIEFCIFATVAVLFIPFGALKATTFLFERVTFVVFTYGIKLMIMYFMIGLLSTYMNNISFSTGAGYITLLQQAFSMLILGLLVWKIPAFASNVMIGQGTLNASEIVLQVAHVAAAASTAGVSGAAEAANSGATIAAANSNHASTYVTATQYGGVRNNYGWTNHMLEEGHALSARHDD